MFKLGEVECGSGTAALVASTLSLPDCLCTGGQYIGQCIVLTAVLFFNHIPFECWFKLVNNALLFVLCMKQDLNL